MDDVGNARNEAKAEGVDADLGTAATDAIENERRDRETGDRVTIEILRERLVVTDKIKLKQRRHRPDGDAGEEGGVSSGELPAGALHSADCGTASRFRSLICSLARP